MKENIKYSIIKSDRLSKSVIQAMASVNMFYREKLQEIKRGNLVYKFIHF